MHAMPVMIAVLCLMAIAYRYYSAFLAAKVATLNDLNQTPALRYNDGHNFDPTNKWVLFGHHFAAISGAGPLIGPVLAAQFGYLPGLLWIVIGVCLGGAAQDFLVLVASMRRDGRSLAQIAHSEIGRTAGIAGTTAILFIIVVALAGLGKVVVKALGGEEVKYPADSVLVLPEGKTPAASAADANLLLIPEGTTLRWNDGKNSMPFQESFTIKASRPLNWKDRQASIPPGSFRIVPGSYWGTFTIAATIPIALFIGLYMYRIRPGKVLEASLIGAALTLAATFAGGLIARDSFLAHALNMSTRQVTVAMAIYGFVAAVLPVWVLLCPRDYLSSFLKIGTIAALVIGTLVANPRLEAPAYNSVFASGGPIVGSGAPGLPGKIFPFLFITIMCGAISGFHSLVSSGTTPKMIKKESDARMIGYGAMLIEGLVGVVAMIAAATLPTLAYYDMNTDLAKKPQWQDRILDVAGLHGVQDIRPDLDPVNEYERLTHESLRGRTGGAVTLAVGFAHIFDKSLGSAFTPARRETLWKYWYHFAIMFEALFILTTIDAGTRIGRFLLQEVAGHVHPALGMRGNWIGSALATGLIVLGWGWFMNADSFSVIWVMFGIANQTLAIIALSAVTSWLFNEGKTRYLWVTILPLCVVFTTTSTASIQMILTYLNTILTQWNKTTPDTKIMLNSAIQGLLILAMFACMLIILISTAARVLGRRQPAKPGGFPVVARA
jgi:carbon starvation protein